VSALKTFVRATAPAESPRRQWVHIVPPLLREARHKRACSVARPGRCAARPGTVLQRTAPPDRRRVARLLFGR
jgi:hypothetical protein